MSVLSAGPRGLRREIGILAVATLLLAGLAAADNAAASTKHCVWYNDGDTTGACSYGGMNTGENDFPNHSYVLWKAGFWNATTGTQKNIYRVSLCCSPEYYGSNVKEWDQLMPGRTTDVIQYFNSQPSPINASAWWWRT